MKVKSVMMETRTQQMAVTIANSPSAVMESFNLENNVMMETTTTGMDAVQIADTALVLLCPETSGEHAVHTTALASIVNATSVVNTESGVDQEQSALLAPLPLVLQCRLLATALPVILLCLVQTLP